MLLSGLQGQDIRSSSVVVSRFTDDPARKLAHQFFLAGHEAKVWSAKAHRHAQLLAFADGDIDIHFTRTLIDGQSDRVAAHDHLGLVFMDDLRALFDFFDQAVVVWRFNVKTRTSFIQLGLQIFDIDSMILVLNHDDLDITAFTIGLHDRQSLRVNRIGNQDLVLVSLQTHEQCFSRCHGTVIDAGVGNVETRQFADLGLVFKNRL